MADMNGISSKEALELLNISDELELFKCFSRASELREKYCGQTIVPCSIINARCGGCPEDCAFCAQSKSSKAQFDKYPLVSKETMFKAAEKAAADKASYFSVVTSGTAVNASKELNIICEAIEKITKELPIKACASLGILNKKALRQLKDSGMTRYHHNLETAGSYFGKICTTRSYESQLDTIRFAKELGIALCVGGIFGMGESKEQRIELLETIRSLDVDSVPLNFLNPIQGTKLEKMDDLSPRECLKIIAAARLMMPDKSIRICGGRERNLGDFQSWIFFAGADGIMIGGYLVTSGREVGDDLKMIEGSGLTIP